MSTVSVNTHFPGYEILGELGRSNARVLKARHLATGDLVAIKHFTLDTDADTLRRFQQESAIMTSIRHPNVVLVREVQLNRPLPFIVMEWVEGGDLRSIFTQRGALDVATIIRLGQQMAGAFSAIHPQGIVHRDIKPENILYRPLPSGELHFLLTDFGVARLREQSQTMTGQSLMTYEYASPEQFDNPKGVTAATDYYSLGVVLYECLTGHVPFSLADLGGIAAFMNQVLYTPPPRPESAAGQYLPTSLNTLMTWSLTKNPADRLSDVAELTLLLGQAGVEQLQAARSGRGIRPVSVSQLPVPDEAVALPADDPSQRSGWWGIVVGLIVVGVMVGGTAYYKSRQQASPVYVAPDSTAAPIDSSGLYQPDESNLIETEGDPYEMTVDSARTEPDKTPETITTVPNSLTTAPDTVARDTSNVNER